MTTTRIGAILTVWEQCGKVADTMKTIIIIIIGNIMYF